MIVYDSQTDYDSNHEIQANKIFFHSKYFTIDKIASITLLHVVNYM